MAKKWRKSGALIERDLGWDKIKKELESGAAHVGVGVHADAGQTDGTPIGDYAFHHEFGDRSAPETAWMRRSFDQGLTSLKVMSTKLFGKVIDGDMTLRQAADQLGERQVAQQRAAIDSAGPGGLIDTENLRNAIKSEPMK